MRSFEKKFLVVLLAFFFVIHSPVFAKKSKTHLFFEKEYQNYWCATQGGVTEDVLSDKTRVDCVTDKYAIEFDFANKWAESIGQ